ncbi:MAG: hypothetical protein GY696_30710 [Gammaproteobacteria bacterium]|nr:hypothetical protein [Gammaproteobacteria bacterium]
MKKKCETLLLHIDVRRSFLCPSGHQDYGDSKRRRGAYRRKNIRKTYRVFLSSFEAVGVSRPCEGKDYAPYLP